jgi:hypothetical protein
MSEQAEVKVCKMCGMEVPAMAKKCPYCHQWQSRWLAIFYHPAFLLIAFVPLLAAYGLMMETMFNRGKDFQPYRDQITVSDTEIVFGETEHGGTVAVLGKMKNGSDFDWKEVQFATEFYNGAGKMVDAGESASYSRYMPAHGTAGFKISFHREFPKELYASCKVRVVAVKDGKAGF